MKKILIAGESGAAVNYETALKKLGAVPVTTLHVPSVCSYDGLLLPGGGDIDPRLFGQLLRGTRKYDPVLDRLQLAILKAFILDRKPVLGICKGMQLINIFFGGDLHQHLAAASLHEECGQDKRHSSTARQGSFLAQLYGIHFTVNSAHHQGVDVPGQGICYVQYGPGEVVEGLVHRYLPVLGVQWHPERMCFDYACPHMADGALLLSYFLSLL